MLIAPTKTNMVGSFTRYTEFVGRGNEDVEKHWYLCEAIWRVRQTQGNVRPVEFQTTLTERDLHWFIKWTEQNQNPTVDNIKRGFVQEFKVLQMDQEGLSELREIKQREGEID